MARAHQLGACYARRIASSGPLWLPYILVRDAGGQLNRQGARSAVIQAMEVPWRWVFTGIDHQGAMFAVHSKKRAAPAAADARLKPRPTVTTKGAKTTKGTKKNRKVTKKTKKKTAKKRK